MKTLFTLLTSFILAGCAGSPVAIANSSNAKAVQVGDETVIVTRENGTWMATFRDYMAKIVYSDAPMQLKRKVAMKSAIEQISGCTVIDSVTDLSAVSMTAQVKCNSPN